jgi:hypothetical protein
MKKVFIIHGFEGSPNGGWRPWLMGELEKRGVYACALPMPNPNNPSPEAWVKEIARHAELSTRDHIYLVGHSLGVPAILRYLEKTRVKNVRGIVLVSGPFFKTTKKKVATFLKSPFDCKAIRSKMGDAVVIHGDNDKAVSADQGAALAEALDAKLVIIKNGNHINGSAGWFRLPQCLKSLEEMINR